MCLGRIATRRDPAITIPPFSARNSFDIASSVRIQYTFRNSSLPTHGDPVKRMLHRSLISLAVLLLLLFSVSGVSALSIDAEEAEVFALVNQQRQKQRLPGLAWDESAARIARAYSRRMAREGFFDHYDPEGNSIMERADRSGLKHWSRIGENLFVCDPMIRFEPFAIRGWLRSPTHRQNMLDAGWTATGVGVARSRDGQIYITQVFLER